MGVINQGLYSSEYDSWLTPANVLERVYRVGPVGLDPCGNAQSIVVSKRAFRLDRGEDALLLDWRDHGLVYVNPPFGDEIGPFMRRMAVFGKAGVEIIGLVPHRSDTAWYQDNLTDVKAKCEWRGRMAFLRGQSDRSQMSLLGAPVMLPMAMGEASAPFPTVLLYWGKRVKRFVAAFEDAGLMWTR